MLYQFQVCSTVIQFYLFIYIHIYIFLFFRFFSLMGYYKILSVVPCALPQIPVGYLLLFFFLNFIYFYFWLLWVFLAAHRLSLVAASGGCSSLRCAGFLLPWPLLWSTGSRHTGSAVVARRLTGLVAPRHVGSSWTRPQTPVPCVGRRILNHCATREALVICLIYCSMYPKLLIYPSLALFPFGNHKFIFLNNLFYFIIIIFLDGEF